MFKNRLTGIATCAVIVFLLWGGCATAPETPVPEPEAPAPADESAPESTLPDEAIEETSPVVDYSRGDTGPAGGIVFYVDRREEFEWTYLEAAPAGWFDGGEDPRMTWGKMGIEVGASGSAIGTGEANTRAIAQEQEDSAAGMIAELTINGYDDWFLPSLGEIGEMYENLFRRQSGDLSRASYWTSTERTPDRAMSRSFDTAGQISARKQHENHVRPIRSF